jgi:hypothetical protein
MTNPPPDGWTMPEKCAKCETYRNGNDCLLFRLLIWECERKFCSGPPNPAPKEGQRASFDGRGPRDIV